MFTVLLAAALQSSPVNITVADNSAPAAELLFATVQGRWSCKGAFASGKALEADLNFSRSGDGKSVRYSHVDRAPNTFRQEANWGVDKDSGRLVSLAFTSFGPDPLPSTALYVADTWSKDKVTFTHQRLFSDPFAPNRFTYSVEGDKLKMLWEVNRSGIWKMGDYLDCDCQPA